MQGANQSPHQYPAVDTGGFYWATRGMSELRSAEGRRRGAEPSGKTVMRINYSEDEDFNNQALMWEANQRRSIKGRKGQSALRELEAALLALPEKRLIANELERKDGEVCAVGALAKFKGVENPMVGDSFGDYDELEVDEYEIEQAIIDHAQKLGVPKLVAVAIVGKNDDMFYVHGEV